MVADEAEEEPEGELAPFALSEGLLPPVTMFIALLSLEKN